MNDEQLRGAYRQALISRAGDRSACPPVEALAGVVDGSAPAAERLATLRHVGGCADCRTDLELLRTATDAATGVMRPWWTSRPALAMAAVLVLAIGGVALWQRSGGGPPGADIMRDGSSAGVILLAPAEDAAVARPVRFTWAAVPGARRYDVEVLDSLGAVILRGSTGDTVFHVTEAAGLTAGNVYRWWVQAGVADGGQPRSLVRRFRLATTP